MKEAIPAKDVMDKGRFDAFTDGVFAVAITLMVLEIHVPELKHGTDAEMREFIGGLGGPLLTYALSFATVGLIWLNHHATFAPVKRVDRTTIVWQYAVRSDHDAPPVSRSVMISGGIGTFFYAAGTLIAFVAPKVSIAIFVAITIYYSLPGLFNLRRHPPVNEPPE